MRDKKPAGSALLYVILITGLLSSLILSFIVRTKDYVVRTGYYENYQKSYYIAKSGLNIAKRLLAQYGSNITEQSLLANELSAYQNGYPLLGGTARLFVYPQGAKFNINELVYADGTVNKTLEPELERLFYILGIPQGLIRNIEVFMQKNNLNYAGLSSKFTKYIKVVESPNLQLAAGEPQLQSGKYKASFLTLRDLMLVPGITYKYYYILKNFLCVNSSGMININFAPYEVIYSLSPLISVSAAKELVNYRVNNPFLSLQDISSVSGFQNGAMVSIAPLIEFNSGYYKIVASGAYKNSRAAITALYFFGGSTPEKLYEINS